MLDISLHIDSDPSNPSSTSNASLVLHMLLKLAAVPHTPQLQVEQLCAAPCNTKLAELSPVRVKLCQTATTHAAGPVLPLSERPVQSRVSKDDLLAWHAAALAQAEAVGSAFEDADGGPSADNLKVWPPFCFRSGNKI